MPKPRKQLRCHVDYVTRSQVNIEWRLWFSDGQLYKCFTLLDGSAEHGPYITILTVHGLTSSERIQKRYALIATLAIYAKIESGFILPKLLENV